MQKGIEVEGDRSGERNRHASPFVCIEGRSVCKVQGEENFYKLLRESGERQQKGRKIDTTAFLLRIGIPSAGTS